MIDSDNLMYLMNKFLAFSEKYIKRYFHHKRKSSCLTLSKVDGKLLNTTKQQSKFFAIKNHYIKIGQLQSIFLTRYYNLTVYDIFCFNYIHIISQSSTRKMNEYGT